MKVKGACDTCAKRGGNGSCRVLKKPVGETAVCWAWSDDLRWEEKAEAAAEAYALRG